MADTPPDKPNEVKSTAKQKSITVSGVRFTADQVKSAVIVVDGREITIGNPPDDDEKPKIGFSND